MAQNLVTKARIEVEKNVFEEEEDMISALPGHILHEIMSLLPPRYAAITSVLSQRWLQIWLTFPSIHIDEKKFMNREQFFHCLRATFAGHDLLSLQNLRLRMLRPRSLELYQLIDRFMDVVLLQGALRTLALTFLDYHLGYEELYVLQKEMFSLSSSLVILRIEGCRFKGFGHVNLPSLKCLFAKNVTFTTQDLLQDLIQGCPVLEKLLFKYCDGVKNLLVSHPALNKLVLGLSDKIESLELDVPCVTSMRFKSRDYLDDKLTRVLSHAKIQARNLRTFRLKHFTMGSELLHNITSFFPKLEWLNMRYCEVLGRVTMSSNSLMALRMTYCIFQEEMEITAPNLQAIEYLHNSRGIQSQDMEFMHLTRILLSNVQVSGILSINDSRCPNLESLDLISCKNMRQLRIVSGKLEYLKVSKCDDLKFFTVVALQLSHFSYGGQVVRNYQIVASGNLEVILHLEGPQGYHDHGEMELHKFTQFLHKCYVSAKAVTLRMSYDCAMCLLMMKEAHVPPLGYLLHLKIETGRQVISLVDLLHCALSVSVCYNTLSMDVGLFSMTLQFEEIDNKQKYLRKTSTDHACIEEHLTGVEMINFEGSDEEVELLRFLITNVKQMKRMTIWTRKEEDHATENRLGAFHWMHRLPRLFKHFDIVSNGSYTLFSKI